MNSINQKQSSLSIQVGPAGRAMAHPMDVARSRGTPPDATPRCCATVHDPFAREPAGCPTRWRAHARHLPMHPPTVPPYTIRSPETSFPPLPAPRYTDARPTMPPYTIHDPLARERHLPMYFPSCLPYARARAPLAAELAPFRSQTWTRACGARAFLLGAAR